MADYFVDSTTGNNGDSGLTMDLAWATLEYAFESGGLSAGDWVWVRRIHVEYGGNPTSHIEPVYDGTPENPIRFIGWPRNAFTITSATWTNGSTTVDSVLPASLDREQHLGRYVTAPDGETYLITKIVDANTFLIDREYASSVGGGAASILADEDYATAQAINDSGWTITKATYNADADDVPVLDFKNTAYAFYINGDFCYHIANMEMRDSTNSYGVAWFRGVKCIKLVGCLFYNDQNDWIVNFHSGGFAHVERCIVEGSGAGGTQIGVRWGNGAFAHVFFKNCAVYNCGNAGLSILGGDVTADGLNVGVEAANGSYDIAIVWNGRVQGTDVKLGGTNGLVSWSDGCVGMSVALENYGKILGAHKVFTPQGEITKKDVFLGSGDPYRRSSGADAVVELLYNLSSTSSQLPTPIVEWTPVAFVHEFEVGAESRSYRYYVQAEAAITAAQLWLECEYVSSYDDASEYTYSKVQSDEAITIRSGVGDWSQYLEVTGVDAAVASKIRIKLYCRYYHATNKIYVDPMVVVT